MKQTKFGKIRALVCLLISLCLVFALAACNPEPGETTEGKITLAPATVSVEVDKTVAVTATLTGITGDVTWTSSDDSVATVAPATEASTKIATVKGVKAGTATITATAGGKTATCAVTVTAAGPGPGDEAETVTIKLGDAAVGTDPYNMHVEGTLTFTATASKNSAITWESSAPTVATVAGGVVTGVAAGEAVITAKVSDEIKATVSVKVTASTAVAFAAEESFANGWRYWTGGPEVTATTYADDNELHVTYSADGGQFWAVQAFYKDKYANVKHNVSFTLVSPVAGAIHICGTRFPIVEGENEISVTDFRATAENPNKPSTIDIQFGDVNANQLLTGDDLAFVIKDIVITAPDVTAELSAPSFSIDDEKVITITDENEAANVGRYELGLFTEETDELPAAVVNVTSGNAIDLSAVSTGVYTAKLRAVNDSETVMNSAWSSDSASVESVNTKTYFPSNTAPADTWYYWMNDGTSVAENGMYMENGVIYIVNLTGNASTTYDCQLKLDSSKAITSIHMTIRCDHAGFVGFNLGNQDFELTAVDGEEYYEVEVVVESCNGNNLIICLAGNQQHFTQSGHTTGLTGNITISNIVFTYAE